MKRSIHEVNDQMKRMLSTSSAKERSIKKPKSSLSNSKFLTNIPKWGENVSENNNLISFTNTCTIEYFLFAMWTAWRLEPFGFQDGWPDLSKNIYEIIQNIENNEWKKGKSIWTTKVKKKKPKIIGSRRSCVHTWGNENEICLFAISCH